MKRMSIYFAAVFVLILMTFPVPVLSAETKDGMLSDIPVPVISTKITSTKNGVKLTISGTTAVDGYQIYMKAPGAKKFKLIKTLKQKTALKSSFTKKNLIDGKYVFKARAYRILEDGSKQTGEFCENVKVVIDTTPTLSEVIAATPELIEWVNPWERINPDEPADGDYWFNNKLKDGAVLEDGYVLRLVAIDKKQKNYAKDIPVVVDEEKMSITGVKSAGTVSLMIFAYASPDDAERHLNPIARSARQDVEIGYEKYADITFKNGFAYFGRYPQTKVTDKTVIAELDRLSKTANSQVITYKDDRYIYSEYSKCWCKDEKVEWVILEGTADSDSVTLMSSKVLLESGHSAWKEYSAGGSWKDSFVRNHLNGYNKSFDNIWAFDFFGVLFEGNTQRVLMEQTYKDCSDRVLLPSKKQLSKLTASERIRKATDLCKKSDLKGYWCIDSDGKGNICVVNPKGEFITNKAYQQDGQGFVPVIKVDLRKCNVKIK